MKVSQRMVMAARSKLAKKVQLCILPNEGRARLFQETIQTTKPVEVVWNVPSVEEVIQVKTKPAKNKPLKLFYGGTLTPKILPKQFVEKVAKTKRVELHIVGYKTYSEKKFYCWLTRFAASKKNIKYYGCLSRYKMLSVADKCEAAICLYSPQEKQLNFKHLVGASNKPFDAMARGLAVVISDLPAWTSMYLGGQKEEAGAGGGPGHRILYAGEKSNAKDTMGKHARDPEFRVPDPGTGYGIAINPESGESIRVGLEWMLNNREKLWEMGERGRLKIQKDWNYKKIFQKVQNALEKT